jgi:arylsulfatase A-like enzyme
MFGRDCLILTWICTVAIAACFLVCDAHAQRSTAAPPNIVLIMADDLGYGHLGCYGQEHIRTPNIDKLASGGIRFTQAYAGSSVCAPSRSVLMTGYHAGHTPIRLNSGAVPLLPEDVTLGEVLQEAGYVTGAFGKWSLGEAFTDGMPTRQGFDEFFGYFHQLHAHYYFPDYLWHNEKRYDIPGNMGDRKETYSHDLIMEKALDFIRRHGQEQFFCYLPVTLPHGEWVVPEVSLREYAGTFEENPPKYRWREGYALPKEPKATMAAMISHLDKDVGRVMDLLQELGVRDNTLVIFMSDNGGSDRALACPEFFQANRPLRDYKGSLYEGGIRVPAIANWPGRIEAGAVSDHVWHFADMMPTLAELSGGEASVPKDTDGLSFAPTLLGSEQAGREQRQHKVLVWQRRQGSLAARMGNWKAVSPTEGAPFELYDLSRDVAEANDLADKHTEVVATMRGHLEKQIESPRPQIEVKAPGGRKYR